MKKISMDDIANALGISKSLVSLAISNKYGVSEETRSKIVLYALQNGYDFESNRSQMANTSRNGKISVFMKKEDILHPRFWPQILLGIEQEIANKKYGIKVETWDEEAPPSRMIVELVGNMPMGMIILNDIPSQFLEYTVRLNIPIVLVDSKNMLDADFNVVRANNYSGGYVAADYLINKGHRKLLFVGNINFAFSFLERFYGFKDCIDFYSDADLYLAIDKGQGTAKTVEELYDEELVLKYVTSENEHSPTCIMCENDPIAISVITLLQKNGIKVPDDVSVMGFDNIKECIGFSPQLTTVDVPKNEMGKQAIRLLVNQIKYSNEVKKTILVNATIIERGSVIRI